MAVSGDITEITYNHPTLGSGVILCKSGEDSTIDRGGKRSNDDENMIDGAGNMLDQINNVRWGVEVTAAADITNEVEKQLIDMAGDPEQGDWTFTVANYVIYSGKGKPVGDIKVNANAGTLAMKVAGGGTLKKIS